MVDAGDGDQAHPSATESLDAIRAYARLLEDGRHSMPVAAVQTLADVIERSEARTMSELLAEVNRTATLLKKAACNPISLSAGTALLLRFISLTRPPSVQSFGTHKRDLAQRARDFVAVAPRCADLIAQEAANFIEDGQTVMTSGYSRVVTKALLHASSQRKRFTVLVAESRPLGTGLYSHAVLSKAGIPCTTILDAAVAYSMPTCDLVFLGAEGVAENGGLISGIGSFQMALAAQAFNKPVYGLAESYKFLRLYPLSQADLPTPTRPLTATSLGPSPMVSLGHPPSRPMRDSPVPKALEMTDEMLEDQPLLDFVTPNLVRAIISDLSVSTPAGVSDTLLSVFGGE